MPRSVAVCQEILQAAYVEGADSIGPDGRSDMAPCVAAVDSFQRASMCIPLSSKVVVFRSRCQDSLFKERLWMIVLKYWAGSTNRSTTIHWEEKPSSFPPPPCRKKSARRNEYDPLNIDVLEPGSASDRSLRSVVYGHQGRPVPPIASDTGVSLHCPTTHELVPLSPPFSRVPSISRLPRQTAGAEASTASIPVRMRP